MTNLPISGKFNITATFKQIGKHWKTLGFHTGIDFTGDSTIYATCDGIVDTIAYSNSYGNYIIIKEKNIDRYHYFCHLARILVKRGQIVNRLSVLGIMGNTGNSTGKHLHYEIRKQKGNLVESNLINPADYCKIPNIKGTYNSDDYQLNEDYLKYQVHIQNIGWQEEKENGEFAGTEGQGLRVEAIVIHSNIPIQYRVHIQDKGWSEYVPNSCIAGTIGESLRIEAIEIISSSKTIKAQAHIQNIGWQEVIEGTHIKIGTEGRALRLEALKLEYVK